jgi:hypothetical protein
MIELDSFKNLFKIVTKHSRKQVEEIKSENAFQRREYLKEGNEEEYKDIVK